MNKEQLAEPGKDQTKTPAAKWREAGEADPHAGVYDCERHQLTCGSMTDDELANAVFLHDHAKFDMPARDNVAKFQWLNDRGPRAPRTQVQIAHDTALSQRRLDLQMRREIAAAEQDSYSPQMRAF